MNPEKIFFGLPAYGWNWQIYDLPANLGKTYRGTSNTYYAAKNWMTGQYNFTDDAPPQPFIPILAYWDDYDMVPWALPQVYDFMAEGESVSISENNKWSIQKRFEGGTYKVSYPPYGYDWDGEQMVINPEQAAVVKEIFAALLSGKGTHAIADDLNRRGIPTKRNGRWTATTIRGMLSNEKYVGDCLFQKTYSDSRFVRHNNHGEQTQYMPYKFFPS